MKTMDERKNLTLTLDKIFSAGNFSEENKQNKICFGSYKDIPLNDGSKLTSYSQFGGYLIDNIEKLSYLQCLKLGNCKDLVAYTFVYSVENEERNPKSKSSTHN